MRVRVSSTVMRSQKHAPAMATREAPPEAPAPDVVAERSAGTHATSGRPQPRHDGRGSITATERPCGAGALNVDDPVESKYLPVTDSAALLAAPLASEELPSDSDTFYARNSASFVR